MEKIEILRHQAQTPMRSWLQSSGDKGLPFLVESASLHERDIFGLDAEAELANILSQEIIKECQRAYYLRLMEAWDDLCRDPSYQKIDVVKFYYHHAGFPGGVNVKQGKEGTSVAFVIKNKFYSKILSNQELMAGTIKQIEKEYGSLDRFLGGARPQSEGAIEIGVSGEYGTFVDLDKYSNENHHDIRRSAG
jgi:hypothetical protein